MKPPCERCPTPPMCMHKGGLELLRECPHIESYLMEHQGTKLRKGGHRIIGIAPIKMRFIVTRSHLDEINIGYIESNDTFGDAWHSSYEGEKSV